MDKKPDPKRPETTSDVHKPSLALLIWLAISIPLVAWDTLYVLLRPHTMPGGKYFSTLWKPHALYGSVDHVYGWPAWNARAGFTAAQSTMNVFETAFYCWYFYVVCLRAPSWSYQGITRSVARDRGVNLAVLVCLSAAVMTLSKTLLYWLNEAFSDFANIRHNSVSNIVFLWLIPNGAWIVLPTYMIYVLGKDVLDSMSGAKVECGSDTERAKKVS